MIYLDIHIRKETIMLFHKKKNPLDDKLNELQMNLENNYKDLAIAARKEAEDLYTKMKTDGILKEKEAQSYRKRLDDYAKRMEHYDHTNISNFLKERY